MRRTPSRTSPILLLIAVLVPSIASAWPPSGVPLAPGLPASSPRVLLGRDTTAFTFWADNRWGEPSADIYAQLVTSRGEIAAGWPDTALMVSRARFHRAPVAGISDPDGSFLVGWGDGRDGPYEPYLSRVLSDGRIDPTWPRHGLRIFDPEVSSGLRALVWSAPDTVVVLALPEGAIDGCVLQSLAITPQGPVPVWGSSGVSVDMGAELSVQTAGLVADGEGGVYLLLEPVEGGAWIPGHPNAVDVYVMRIAADGRPAEGWESGPKPVAAAPGSQWLGSILADGEGGLYVAWTDDRNAHGDPGPAFRPDIRLQRLTSEGVPHSGWPVDGLPLTERPDGELLPTIAPDGAGGVYVNWVGIKARVVRVRGDGTFAPGWFQGGIEFGQEYSTVQFARIVPDAETGLYLLFQDQYDRVFLQHVLPTGVADPGWPAAGHVAGTQRHADLVADGTGGCYVAYVGRGNSTWLTRYDRHGRVPPRLAEATVEAWPGRVVLAWMGAEAPAAELTVERRESGIDAWTSLGHPAERGGGGMSYVDTTVQRGVRYVYRLVLGTELMSVAAWVNVPASWDLALAATPNPAHTYQVSVAFTLDGSAPARLEVLDLAGRREYARALHGFGAGRHTASLGQARLSPGVHWLRITEGEREANLRVVVVQ